MSTQLKVLKLKMQRFHSKLEHIATNWISYHKEQSFSSEWVLYLFENFVSVYGNQMPIFILFTSTGILLIFISCCTFVVY